MAARKKKYIVTAGRFIDNSDRNHPKTVKVGGTCELTDEQYENFKDQFEPATAASARRAKAKAVAEAEAKADAEAAANAEADDEADAEKEDEGGDGNGDGDDA